MYPGNDIQGWMSQAELNWLYQQAQAMSPIVEVGSWKGRSTHALCSGCKGLVVAVDHWLTPLYGEDPTLAMREFYRNTGKFNNLMVMRRDSLAVADSFKEQSVDMVFLDGCHEYQAIKADILAWLPKVRKLICGHDYSETWPGVRRAVEERFGQDFGVFEAIWFYEL